MAKPDFVREQTLLLVHERLLEAGVAPRHVQRYVDELTDHLNDLTAEEQRAGLSRTDARAAALRRLGGVDELAKPDLIRENTLLLVHERLLEAGVAPRHVRRYMGELTDHLNDLTAEEQRAGLSRTDARAAARRRLGGVDELSKPLIEQREFQSWSVRAPWAVFGITPLLFLAGAWAVALLLLWSGWRMFLPGEDTPFVPIHGMAVFYFGVGRSIFLGAPILTGWAIGLVALRQRLRFGWPAVGLVLLALVGGAAKVHAEHLKGRGVAGHIGRHISLGFTLAPSVRGNPYGLLHVLVILVLILVPYLIVSLRKPHDRLYV